MSVYTSIYATTPREIIERLRHQGHEVNAISESLRGIKNGAVLAYAVEIQALLITADKDFGELIIKEHRQAVGVLLLRFSEETDDVQKANQVSALVQKSGQTLVGCFTVLSEQAIRQRPLPQTQSDSDIELEP
ncbi:MAG: DUF5615 family PIN-like protein [Acaryochloris sp. RU_4_1]|nr:DUF5615 family PIN-like protein [Acaryochloris sp. RU_4_1]